MALADQISREFKGSDRGIDMEIEFTDDAHKATGVKLTPATQVGRFLHAHAQERRRGTIIAPSAEVATRAN